MNGVGLMREHLGTEHSATLAGRDDLPKHADIRWIRRRKARVVAAVRAGIFGLHEALERYNLSIEEFIEWEREVSGELTKRRRTGRMRELTVMCGKMGRPGRAV
jgi:hypothetical protein